MKKEMKKTPNELKEEALNWFSENQTTYQNLKKRITPLGFNPLEKEDAFFLELINSIN